MVEVRKKLSDKLTIAPVEYLFSDYTLEEFAKRKPASKQDMINIDGVGGYKLKHYCPAFLETIQNYKAKVYEDLVSIPCFTGCFFEFKVK
ncbi:HRDC domain-containing protein [Staphylococcus aureus]